MIYSQNQLYRRSRDPFSDSWPACSKWHPENFINVSHRLYRLGSSVQLHVTITKYSLCNKRLNEVADGNREQQ